MRALLAVALIVGGAVVLPVAADARRAVRSVSESGMHPRYYRHHDYRPRYRPRTYYQQPGYYYRQPGQYERPPSYYSSEQAACEARAQAEDPAGIYAGYPCWARSAFGRGSSGGRR